ncbi:MAG: RNA polymerase sigma factor [Runella sp.]
MSFEYINHFTSSKTLLERLHEGEEKAFAEVYQQYHRWLYAIGLKYLKNPDLAQDALQEVFLKLWEHRHTLRDEESLKAYLSVIMRNHVLNVIRNQNREIQQFIEYTLNWSEVEDSSDSNRRWEEYLSLVDQGVSQLSPQKRKIFQLRLRDHLNNEQIAQRLGLSINTVKFQFSQALHFLRTYVRNRADVFLLSFLSNFL